MSLNFSVVIAMLCVVSFLFFVISRKNSFVEKLFRREKVACFYLIIASLSVSYFAFLIPPFTVADEYMHWYKAAYSGSVGAKMQREGSAVGSSLPCWITEVVDSFADLPRNESYNAYLSDIVRAKNIQHTKKVKTCFARFNNTAAYPSYFYMPQAAAFFVGSLFDVRPSNIFLAARLLNGFCGITIGFLSLVMYPQLQVFFATLLLLPMTMHQMSSVSADATMIPFSLLIISLMCLALDHEKKRPWIVPLVWAGVLMLAQARLPLIALGVPLLSENIWSRNGFSAHRDRVVGIISLVICFIAWCLYAISLKIQIHATMNGIVPGNMQLILNQPLEFLFLCFNTIKVNFYGYLYSMVGVLGWLDTPVPFPSFVFALCGLTISIGVSISGGIVLEIKERLYFLFGFLGCVFLSLIIFFLTWTEPNKSLIEGFQGRYLLCMVGCLPCIFVSRRAWISQESQRYLTYAALSCSLISLSYVPWTFIEKFFKAS